MTPHCFLTGHDVDNRGSRELPDRCVHCGVELPISRLRIAREAVLRGLAVIAFVAIFAGARLVKDSMGPRLEPEKAESH